MTGTFPMYQGMAVAVTGSGGYVGAALVKELQAAGADVVAVTRSDDDVRDLACWSALVARAGVIFHLAGNTSALDAERDPDASLASTVDPCIHLATAARAAGRRPRVVFASTATVYGLTASLPVDEDADTQPVTTYDRHKLAAEQHLAASSHDGVVDGVSLRLANVYGPSPSVTSASERGVLNRIAMLAVRGADVSLFGGGDSIRDYVYLGDVVSAFMRAGLQPGMGGRSYNVGSGTGITIRDACRLVIDRAAPVAGKRSTMRLVDWPDTALPIDRRHFTANVERMATACGWRPQVTLAEGIRLLIDALVISAAGRSHVA